MARSCYEEASRYLQELGWNSLAVCPPDHVGTRREHARNCTSPGKGPLGPWKYLQETRQSVYNLRRAYHEHPNANVGVVLGNLSRLVGIDIDGPGGQALLDRLSGGDLPPTPAFSTARGLRLLYALSPGEESPGYAFREAAGARLEVLGQGRQTVMPPSLHLSGTVYSWLPAQSCWEVSCAHLPNWARSLGRQRRARGNGLEEGKLTENRNDTLFRLACALRRHGASRGELRACLDIFNQRCEPPLEERELDWIATSASSYSPERLGA